nr:MAG TPA: hypothetical protein [Caudoviricetes sp.]
MKDRIHLYPGRVKLNPVSGQPNTFDLVRADQPTQEGTPLNKASLLKDTTAAAFGLPNTAVPDDALRLLSRFQSGLGNEYIWAKINREIKDTYDETVYTDSSTPFMQPSGASTYTMSYGDSYTVDENGSVTFTGETGSFSLSAPFNPGKFEILKGKWFNDPRTNKATIYLPADTTITQTADTGTSYLVNMRSSNGWTSRKNFKKDVIFDTLLGYVNSPNYSAYPPTEDDGYIYEPFGQLGAGARIATGSYTGTGTYGASNPNSLTFEFEPKIIYIKGTDDYNMVPAGGFIWVNPSTDGIGYYGGGSSSGAWGHVVITWGKTVTWYSKDSYLYQINWEGKSYTYFAIG